MADLLQYKCPNCGGAIEFDPAAQKMKCPYCDTEFEIEVLKQLAGESDAPETDMTWNDKPDGEWSDGETDGMSVYQCKSCGGEVVGDNTLGASSCPFCGNPIVMKGKFSGDLKPDLVIPFKKTKEDAKKAYLKHLEGKKLLPKVFKDQNHIDEIKGMYVPVWLFDADLDGTINYDATKVRTWEDANYKYTETSHYKLYRSGKMAFNNIPVDGSSKMPDILMESIEPFDVKEGVDFETAYLSGYLADRYDDTAEDKEKRANERIKSSAETEFEKTTSGYSSTEIATESLRLLNNKYRYALYPVWMLNTTWNGEKFTFIMNGQTGKMAGDLPVDKSAANKSFGITAVIGAVVTFVILCLINGGF